MNKIFYLIIIFLLVMLDVYIFKKSSDLRIFLIVILFSIFLKVFLQKSFFPFILSFIFLVLSYVSFMITDNSYFINPGENPVIAERFAVWTFIFFAVGVVQKIFGKELIK